MQEGPDKLATIDAAEGAIPIPPRYWWLKRLSLAGAVLVFLLVGLRLYWGYEADRRLERAREEIRAKGLAATVDEINAGLDAVADENNAALLIEKAMAQLVFTSSTGLTIDSFLDDPLAYFYDDDVARELLNKNTVVLDLIHQARFKPEVAWSARLPANPPGALQRNVAKLLWFAGTQQRLTHDDRAAVRTIHDGVAFSDSVAEYSTLVSNMTAWACEGLILTLVEDLDSSISAEPAPTLYGLDQPEIRADVEALIDALLDESRMRRTSVDAYHAESLRSFQYIERLDEVGASAALGSSRWLDVPFWILAQPCHVLDAEGAIRLNEVVGIAASLPDWPSANALISPETEEFSLLTSVRRPLSISSFGSWRRTYRSFTRLLFRMVATRRMAAIALAIRLYQHDHGARPTTLDALVPEYFDALPSDPFDAEGGAIRLGTSSGFAVLYSIGENGVDDGGTEARRGFRFSGMREGDFVFALEGREKWRKTRRGLGLGEASEHEDHEEHRER
ncbi:MAG: hypothetical protein KDA54_09880 [Phycisphaerales bacterium]|nr:hypothetical protein [Phycisphaerales bacterium]